MPEREDLDRSLVHDDGIFRNGGQVGEQGLETVNGEAVFGSFMVGLGESAGPVPR